MKKALTAFLLGALIVVGLALPGAASAGQNCTGSMRPGEAEIEDDPTPVEYRFQCAEQFSTFQIVSTEQIDSFNPEPDVRDPQGNVAPAGGSITACEGVLPGTGFSCLASAYVSGGFVTGTFETPTGACARDRQGRVRTIVYLVVDSAQRVPGNVGSRRLSVFRLGRVHRCGAEGREGESSRRG